MNAKTQEIQKKRTRNTWKTHRETIENTFNKLEKHDGKNKRNTLDTHQKNTLETH